MKNEDIRLLYIDLFCGAGGTSTGVEFARFADRKCCKVIACVNHVANAIASHAANHPEALHFTEDIRTLDLTRLIEYVAKMRKLYPNAFVVLWASLECTNFSKAKGGLPRDADSRTLAEHLFRYIEALNPDFVQIENVEEFMSWGDLDENGKPVSKDAGRLYHVWVENVKAHGYEFDHRILNSADFGAHTSRKRFFGIFARPGLPIVFPEPTHTKNPEKGLFGTLQRWNAVKDCLDFTDEGESIFDRKKDLVEASLDRVLAGCIKFVAGGKDKWLMKYNSLNRQTRKHIPPSVDDPCPTVSCQGRLGVVRAKFLTKHFSGHPESKSYSVEQPAHTITPRDHHSVVSTRFIAKYYSGRPENKVSSIEEPAPTIRTRDGQAMVSAHFVDQQFGQSKPAGIDQPCGALTQNPKYNLVSCNQWVMNTGFNNVGSSLHAPAPVITANRKWHYLVNPQFNSQGGDINAPCFTLIARMDKRPPSLVEVTTEAEKIPSFIKIDGDTVIYEIYETDSPKTKEIKEFMALYGLLDIKMRMLRIPELKMIMGFPKDYVLIGTQSDQKKFIGNAVEVKTACAMAECLVREIHRLKLQPCRLAA